GSRTEYRWAVVRRRRAWRDRTGRAGSGQVGAGSGTGSRKWVTPGTRNTAYVVTSRTVAATQPTVGTPTAAATKGASASPIGSRAKVESCSTENTRPWIAGG